MDKNFFDISNDGTSDRPTSVFFQPTQGVMDTINKRHPKIWAVYKEMKAQDWDENEFEYSLCAQDFVKAPKDVSEIMIETLAWQWEADSVASKYISFIAALYDPCMEVAAAWQRITDNEIIHAATYSEIVRNSFNNPQEVMSEIIENAEALQRLTVVGEVFETAHRVGIKRQFKKINPEYDDPELTPENEYDAIFMFTVALLLLERIQFMSSFAITFGIANTGLFMPIGKSVQKIAIDELNVHVSMDKAVLMNEIGTEMGSAAFDRNRNRIIAMINEVVRTEVNWTDHLFHGRSVASLTPETVKRWMFFMATDVSNFFGVQDEMEWEQVQTNPLARLMSDWLEPDMMQSSAQEEQLSNYRVNIITRDEIPSEDFNFGV